jgi:hypothetical protein
MHEGHEIVVLPGEICRLDAEEFMHPGVPPHGSGGKIVGKGPDAR